MLKYTYHPLADIGVATLCAIAGRAYPEDITTEDLDRVGDYLMQTYKLPVMSTLLDAAFTFNYPFTNPTISPEKFKVRSERLIRPHRVEPDPSVEGLTCAFSGQPATHVIDRGQMPMLTSEGVINFYPAGESGLPVSAAFLLALQCLPLGARRCEGRLLLVHSDVSEITRAFAEMSLRDNQRLLALDRDGNLPAEVDTAGVLETEMPGGLDKKNRVRLPDAKAVGSLFMSRLSEVVLKHDGFFSCTVLHMSNSGQGPSFDMRQIPAEMVSFLRDVQRSEEAAGAWRDLVESSWAERTAKLNRKSDPVTFRGTGRTHNDLLKSLYEVCVDSKIDPAMTIEFLNIIKKSKVNTHVIRLVACHIVGMSAMQFTVLINAAKATTASEIKAVNDAETLEDYSKRLDETLLSNSQLDDLIRLQLPWKLTQSLLTALHPGDTEDKTQVAEQNA